MRLQALTPEEYKMRKGARGFTLLELSVVLIIIALITGMAVTSGISVVAAARLSATQKKMKGIEDALMAYRVANDRIPCPASLSIPQGGANYGMEAANPGSCTGGTPAATFSASGAAEGAVPAVTLGLPSDIMYDGWGNQFRFAADVAMTADKAFSTMPLSGACGAITVCDAGGVTTGACTNTARSGGSIYAIVSHGPNGHGAYGKSGTVINAGSDNASELVNCHCTGSAAPGTYSPFYVQQQVYANPSDPAGGFDDVVTFKERWQMRTDWDAGPTSSGICPQLIVGEINGIVQFYGAKSFVPYSTLNVGIQVTGISLTASNYLFVMYRGGNYCAVYAPSGPKSWALVSNPFVNTLYGNNSCAPPGTYPMGSVSADGLYFAYAATPSGGSPALTFFNNTGIGQWTLIGGPSNPPTQPSIQPSGPLGYVTETKWSADGRYLFISFTNSNGGNYPANNFLYKNNGGVFTQLTFPSLPASAGSALVNDAAFSPDNSTFLLGSNEYGPCKIYPYAINEGSDSFTYNGAPILSDNSCANSGGLTYSPNGQYLAQGSYYGRNLYVYQVGAGSTFTLLPAPVGWTSSYNNSGTYGGISWSSDSGTIAFAHPAYGSNVDMFSVSGTTVTFLQEFNVSGGYGVATLFTH